MKKLYIKTFGCQMNEYDSAKMTDVLAQGEAIQKVDTPEEADIILFNTCSVREKAQEKVFSDLGRVKNLKKNKPDLVIGVGGCVASQEGKVIIDRAPYVDVVFGPQTLHRLPELIRAKQSTGKAQVDISFPEIEKFDHLPPAKVDGGAAFVSIMEGCSKYCTFCVVPYTRGEEVSRPMADILAEIANLTRQGVKEINLLGQNVNAYRGVAEHGLTVDFAHLLNVIHDMDGVERLRFTTSHPREFTERLVDCYAKLPKLVSHLHLPVQSGSDRVLMNMKRGYTALEYKSLVRKLRAVRPDLLLSSDFIVGFPGETETEFEATLNMVKELAFDTSYTFIYSPRPGTPAANLPDDVSQKEKVRRLSEIVAMTEENAYKTNIDMIGTVQKVLVTGLSKRGEHTGEKTLLGDNVYLDASTLVGRTASNRPVHFEAPVRLINQMIDVRITEAFPFSLKGEVIVLE
ncbi:MAG: tRNA (N6-isopentenyl adenosine(37)-C2)-methylthiotransferase MiaB [Neisseriaceae bacterium]|nr:tRNA (N6-isopentenyl adenosine(37)-C2)-methylthiotransferase MiaB [Neisseriaceae bacterium]